MAAVPDHPLTRYLEIVAGLGFILVIYQWHESNEQRKIELEEREYLRIQSSWDRLYTEASGNSGKGEAITWLANKGRSLDSLDLRIRPTFVNSKKDYLKTAAYFGRDSGAILNNLSLNNFDDSLWYFNRLTLLSANINESVLRLEAPVVSNLVWKNSNIFNSSIFITNSFSSVQSTLLKSEGYSPSSMDYEFSKFIDDELILAGSTNVFFKNSVVNNSEILLSGEGDHEDTTTISMRLTCSVFNSFFVGYKLFLKDSILVLKKQRSNKDEYWIVDHFKKNIHISNSYLYLEEDDGLEGPFYFEKGTLITGKDSYLALFKHHILEQNLIPSHIELNKNRFEDCNNSAFEEVNELLLN